MDEAKLQELLEGVIGAGKLLDRIQGQEEVSSVYSSLRDPTFLPSFPVDYLIRQRVVRAADKVLGCIGSLKSVSDKNANISATKGEQLYPDLLFCNEDMAVFVLFELKVGHQTPRQTLTEVLAYQHEIQNHLPFLSNEDLLTVIVATEYTALLDHSLALQMTWDRKNFLCLKASETGGNLELSVHLPGCWSAVGQTWLPPDAFQICQLCLYPHEGVSPEEVERVAYTAIELTARRGDRINSTGFVLLWKDLWYGDQFQTPFNLTVGVLNPYAVLPAALSSGDASFPDTPISRYMLENGRSRELSAAYGGLADVCRDADEYLRQWCRPTREAHSTWFEERAADVSDSSSRVLEHRALPLTMDFWGVLGDYARDWISHPCIRETRPEMGTAGLDWRFPEVGVPILEQLALPPVFGYGEFGCTGISWLGVQIGRVMSLAKTCTAVTDGNYGGSHAALRWNAMRLDPALREVGIRYASTPDITVEPPTLHVYGPERASETLASLQAWSDWFVGHFLGKDHRVHADLFRVSLRAYFLYDDYLRAGATPEQIRQIEDGVAEFCRSVLAAVAEDAVANVEAGGESSETLKLLHATFPELPESDDASVLTAAISGLATARIVEAFRHSIPQILDSSLPQVFHRLAGGQGNAPDWAWMRQQTAHQEAAGKRGCLVLQPNGEVAVGNLDSYGGPLPTLDEKTQVLVVRNEGGPEIVIPMDWVSIENGSLLGDLGSFLEGKRD